MPSARDTRKASQKKAGDTGAPLMTIPQLRKAFKALETSTRAIVQTKAKANQVDAFQKEWKRIFKRSVSEAAAKEYLEFKSHELKTADLKQKGGAAPLGYTMGPGASESGAGAYLDYVSRGFSVGIPADSISAQCGQIDTTPRPLASASSNEVTALGMTVKSGGGSGSRSRRGAATRRRATDRKQKGGMARLFYSTVPPTAFQDAAAGLRGQLPSTPSSSVIDNPIAPANPLLPVLKGAIA